MLDSVVFVDQTLPNAVAWQMNLGLERLNILVVFLQKVTPFHASRRAQAMREARLARL